MKISPLLVPLMILLVLTDNVKIYLTSYVIMAVHELAHLLVAKLIGLKVQCIIFSAFGVNLKLKNRIINTISEEVILYGAGPLVNGILALISIYYNNEFLYRLNITLFIMNLLPIIPLDGGMIALRLLSGVYGNKTARRILNVFSATVGIILLLISIYMLIIGIINISMFIISMFLIGNILTGKEKFNTDVINSLANRKKRSNRVKFTVINDEFSVTDTIKEFSTAYTVFAIYTNENSTDCKILSESEIIEKYHCENLTLYGV